MRKWMEVHVKNTFLLICLSATSVAGIHRPRYTSPKCPLPVYVESKNVCVGVCEELIERVSSDVPIFSRTSTLDICLEAFSDISMLLPAIKKLTFTDKTFVFTSCVD